MMDRTAGFTDVGQRACLYIEAVNGWQRDEIGVQPRRGLRTTYWRRCSGAVFATQSIAYRDEGDNENAGPDDATTIADLVDQPAGDCADATAGNCQPAHRNRSRRWPHSPLHLSRLLSPRRPARARAEKTRRQTRRPHRRAGLDRLPSR